MEILSLIRDGVPTLGDSKTGFSIDVGLFSSKFFCGDTVFWLFNCWLLLEMGFFLELLMGRKIRAFFFPVHSILNTTALA